MSAKKKVSPLVGQLKAKAPAQVKRADFDAVLGLIEAARSRATLAVNTELVGLYWQVGEYISKKIAGAEWGEGVVDELAAHIAKNRPGIRGYSRQNLFRMRQFFETYRGAQKVSSLLRQLQWTQNIMIMSHSKSAEEREFYLRLAVRERWHTRELSHQLQSGRFEQAVLHPPKVSSVMRQMHPEATEVFKDAYFLDFLELAEGHLEGDLHRAILGNLQRFILQMGRDFAFVGSEYPLQVGGRDFALDLLFFHRGLNALVAIELKAGRFEPEHLGKLQFYLEALDRDVKKPHERPSIGMLLCATKDDEVVEYALARSTSPTLIAEYQTMLPSKALMRKKLHEFYAALAGAIDGDPRTKRVAVKKKGAK